jgi:hypothetical protein
MLSSEHTAHLRQDAAGALCGARLAGIASHRIASHRIASQPLLSDVDKEKGEDELGEK